MPLCDFASVFLPYIIEKQEDGRYAVLNREYKPVGFCTGKWINYEEYPVLVRFEGLTKKEAAKISFSGDADIDKIVLYNDGCIPTSGEKAMASYLARLEILAGLRLSVDE